MKQKSETNNTYYNNVINSASADKGQLSKKVRMVSTARLVTVVAGIIAVWQLWGNAWCVFGAIIIAIIIFLVLVKYHEKLYLARLLAEARINIAQDNIDRMNLRLTKCETGNKYIDTHHKYTYDLDVFGGSSLYSLLDTTITLGGADQLASWLICPEKIRSEISVRQQAIKELSELNDFRTDLRAHGIVANDEIRQESTIEFNSIPSYEISKWKRIATYLFPALMLALIILSSIGIVNGLVVAYMFIGGLLLAGLGAKKVSALHKTLDSLVSKISTYHALFAEVEHTQFQSLLLQKLQSKLIIDDCAASIATQRLEKILNNLDQRYNVFGFMILNGFMLWDYRQLDNAVRWMRKYAKSLPDWYDTLSEIDALSALGTYRFNNPAYIFPSLDVEQKIVMTGTQIGHPLIPAQRCVCNMIEDMTYGSFMVVTGANMAGKSTYLRTIGVNYLLALIGAPVFAQTLSFTPVSMFTGLRTTDSLHDNESYFFAELRRLQAIIEQAKSGERMFVILDEILKGTNSIDKQKGSLALVRKLVEMNITGIIATHDLMLGTLADEFPENIKNYCFEAEIKGDTLTFSYRMCAGIAKNMNAYFLMQRMGIV
ncbi:MAG: hypothetical protein RR254_07235 [Muribaculaceae bacterium]